jgi:hypothetical protein
MEIKTMLKSALYGLIVWLIVFVLGEILISGGRSEKNIFLLILELIVIITSVIYINLKNRTQSIIVQLLRGGIITAVFALLDFLIINLLLEGNLKTIYHFWPTYLKYGLLLIAPLIQGQITGLISRKKSPSP